MTDVISKLYHDTEKLYNENQEKVPFHDWNHIAFVYNFSSEFGRELKVDPFLLSVSALTHDLNHLPIYSGKTINEILKIALEKYEFSNQFIKSVANIITDAATRNRNENISNEAKALSDADTLFKALPITPILLAVHFLKEKNINLKQLAEKIVKSQKPLMDKNLYFYTVRANDYLSWGKTNLQLWQNTLEFLDNDIFAEFYNQINNA
jgi:uncharacterized protein